MYSKTPMVNSLEIDLDELMLSFVTANIAIIDEEGTIIAVNQAWTDFGKQNEADQSAALGVGMNYLSVCRKSAQGGDKWAQKSLKGIEAVLHGKQKTFRLEYPCHAPQEKRWFALRANSLSSDNSKAIILHDNITQHKLAEEGFRKMVRTLEEKNRELELHVKRFEHTQQIAQLGSFELDLKTFTNTWSDGHYRIFGLEPQSEAITYERFLEFVIPEDIEKVDQPIQSFTRLENSRWDIEYRINVPGQGIKHILGKAETKLGPTGKVEGVHGVVLDISENIKKESELNLKDTALHHSVTPIAYSNLEGIITYVNPAFVELWGFENENEVLGLSNGQLTSSHKKIAEIMQGVQENGKWSGRDTAKKKDGSLFDIYLSVNLVKDDQGLPICMVASFIDITEQEESKLELVQSEAKYKNLFDYSPIIIWEEDFSQIKSVFDSLRKKGVTDFRSYFENAPEEVKKLSELVFINKVNQTSLDFYRVESKDELMQNLADWFVEDSWDVFTEELIALAEGHTEFESEIKVRTPKGEIKHLFLKLSVPPQHEDTLKVVLLSFLDITERKRKEVELQEKRQEILEYADQLERRVADRTFELALSEARLDEATKMAKIGHWSLDLSEGQINWSKGMYEIYGLNEDMPISKELFFDSVHLDDKEIINKRIEALDRGESVDDIEYRIIDGKGKEKYVRSINKPPVLDDSGNKKILFGVVQDITLQKLNEQKLQQALKKEKNLSELKSRFVSMASHEFRTPLSAILSSAELIKRYGEKGMIEKQVNHIERIRSSVHNLTNILNDFLSLEKLESGKARFIPQRVEFDTHIRDILEEVKPWASEGQAILFEHSGPDEVHIDPHLVKNVLLNLLSNALKYSPEGTDVSLVSENLGDQLQIKVIDQGIGIPEEEQKEMFSRFFRASNVTNLKGTGLGLTILKRYLDLMEATISFESKLGEGTTFTVLIPQ